jgi:cob(I)alamin adenosyltransferase
LYERPAGGHCGVGLRSRRAERLAVHLTEQSVISNPRVPAYLNRLWDVLWLFGRLLELCARVDSSLRDNPGSAPPWSRAW